MSLPTLFILTDRHLKQDLQGGAIIVRDYDHPEREAFARNIVQHCKGPVLIAGDIGLACKLKAAGLHVPQWQLNRLPHRLFRPKGWLITAACHNLKALKKAERHPLVQAALLSPLFATQSHPEKQPLGLVRFGLLARQCTIPLIALGGLTQTQLPQIKHWGASGIALRYAHKSR